MTPLLPFSGTFHSKRISKSPYCSAVIKSPPGPLRVRTPPATLQPAGTVAVL